jgi:hypothetical protein
MARRRGPAALRRSRGAGGWSFACDPEEPAAANPALWQPGTCAHVVIAEPAADGVAAARLADLVDAAAVASEIIAYGAWHLVLRSGGRHCRVAVRSCFANELIAYHAPADRHAELRLTSSLALHHLVAGGEPLQPARHGQPGPTERWRLSQWLRLLDAADAGASARDIAATLILDDVRHFSASEWDTSSERRRIGRWQAAAAEMRDGGYRRLLAAN